MRESLDVWSRACHLVLDQSSRAQLHDIRAALNSIALGVEILRRDDGSDATPRVLDMMQRDLAAAVDELSGLQALVGVAGTDQPLRLDTAVEWAGHVARPVARRYGVDLRISAPAPPVPVDRWLGLAVAVVLIEAARTAPHGSQCLVRRADDRDALLVEWSAAPGSQSRASESDGVSTDRMSEELLDAMSAVRYRLTSDGDRRALRIQVLPLAEPSVRVP